MTNAFTMLELVTAVAARAVSDAEIVATVAGLVNAGAVRLCGSFRGARFDADALASAA